LRWTGLGSLLGCLLIPGCSESEPTEIEPDEAIVASTGIVHVDANQQDNIGLKTIPLELQRMPLLLRLTGWLTAPPDAETTVRAPVDGFVAIAEGRRLPTLGESVNPGKALTRLHVFLTPQEIAQLVVAKEDTDIQLEQALVSMRLAEDQLQRLGNARDAVAAVRVDEVRETYQRSKAAVEEVRDKLPYLAEEPYNEQMLVKPVLVTAPRGGKITQVHVAADQFVLAGDALWTVSDWSTLWVRVPVFEADLPRIARREAAQVETAELSVPLQAAPIDAPLATTPGLRTVDLYYALANPDWSLRAGQSVLVGVPTGMEEDVLLIPQSALLYDGQGAIWVYVRVDGHTFRRQRVEVGMRVGMDAVIPRGLQQDDEIVETGAQALYSEEFKGQIATGDDD